MVQSLFLDIWVMVYELQDAVYGLLVMLGKIDGLLFLVHNKSDQSLFLYCQVKNKKSQILLSHNNI